MNKLPNILSVSRILLSILLFFLTPVHKIFWVVYFICGLSDMLDGTIARKFHFESKLGAQLDSIGDIIFLVVAFIKCIPIVNIPVIIWYWIFLIAVIRAVSFVIGSKNNKTLTILHTIPNKVTGFLLFISPVLFVWKYLMQWEMAVCIIAAFSAIQELLLHIHNYLADK